MSTPLPRLARRIAIALNLLLAILVMGCGRSTEQKSQPGQAKIESKEHAEHADHALDEHPRPENFATGVGELKEHYLEIKKAFEQADIQKAVEQAHQPLHAVGEILEALPDLAQEANLPPADLQAVKQSIDTLFECYGSVDSAVHEKKEPDYRAVAAKVDEAMAAIEAVHTPQEK